MSERKRRFWGWGWEGEGPTREQQQGMAATLCAAFELSDVDVVEPPTIDEITLPDPRVEPPPALAGWCSASAYDRAGHTYGKGFRDIVRAVERRFDHPPDFVAFPRNEDDVVAVLDWCSDQGVAAIPYGGGSSVVGGVEGDVGDGYRGVVSVDLGALDQVVEIDRVSRAARIQGGVMGPALEDQLRPHGLTLRHFPQSFEFSSLGGWLATRSGGHYATLYTHIDEFVEGMRVVTPRGVTESRRLPGSGAGPSPDRLFLGSEGSLGVITEAWMRLQDRPTFRASAPVSFAEFDDAVEAARALAQSGLAPSNCRLLDRTEALTSGAGDGSAHLLLVGFESADHPVGPWMERAVEIVRDHGGEVEEVKERSGTSDAWRSAFLRAPYTRDALICMGMVSETFETSITWDRFPAFHAAVTEAVRGALDEVTGGKGWFACRFTHVYPDGPAPYYTVIAPGKRGSQLAQWDEIKAAASEVLSAHGATITHHHAVGRDHRPWYDRQRPELFAEALTAAKAALDPAGIMNPGVLLPPPR